MGDLSGLVAKSALWLDFSEGSGATLGDRSGNKNDCTIVGPTWQNGAMGPELAFDGVDDRIIDTNLTTLPPQSTVLFVFRNFNKCVRGSGINQTLISLGVSLSNGSFWLRRDDNSDRLLLHYSNGSDEWSSVSNASYFTSMDNTLLFVAMTVDFISPYNVKLYRNNEGLIDTLIMATPVIPVNSSGAAIGSYTITGSHNFAGNMLFCGIVGKILTATEILNVYNMLMLRKWS
jgi:hypothetical protein